jgi:hypothetical protein
VTFAVVAVCCNHPDNGQFTGRCDSVTYDELDLVAGSKGNCTFRVLPGGRLRISRREFRFLGCKEWFGNWCWNAYRMRRKEAHRLVGYLREIGWACEGGPIKLVEWYERSAPQHSGDHE